MQSLRLSVSDFIALTNQTLEYAYSVIEVEGEVASFRVNQEKFVFFDLKDANGSISCFMMRWQLRMPIEDGMKVVVTASPKLTQWGKFSLTVRAITPIGEGNLKKGFDFLKAKLKKEGLFALERKRSLPILPHHIAVISSTQAAGYTDFLTIISNRWGGLDIDVANIQVQGKDAPDQMIRALRYFNSQETLPEVIVLVRGGGSADDLSAFNDEQLVREIAMSRIPTVAGIGHEVDVSLVDLAVDVRAATPSNAAQLLVPDRRDMIREIHVQLNALLPRIEQVVEQRRIELRADLDIAFTSIDNAFKRSNDEVMALSRILAEFDPRKVLSRGYALIRGDIRIGSVIEIEKSDILATAEVTYVNKK